MDTPGCYDDAGISAYVPADDEGLLKEIRVIGNVVEFSWGVKDARARVKVIE